MTNDRPSLALGFASVHDETTLRSAATRDFIAGHARGSFLSLQHVWESDTNFVGLHQDHFFSAIYIIIIDLRTPAVEWKFLRTGTKGLECQVAWGSEVAVKENGPPPESSLLSPPSKTISPHSLRHEQDCHPGPWGLF